MTSYASVLCAVRVTIPESSNRETKYIVETQEEGRGEKYERRDPARQVAVSVGMGCGQVPLELRHKRVEN